jgi:hypothetical protein
MLAQIADPTINHNPRRTKRQRAQSHEPAVDGVDLRWRLADEDDGAAGDHVYLHSDYRLEDAWRAARGEKKKKKKQRNT